MKDPPLGTVSLKGTLLLGQVNTERIGRWIANFALEGDFNLAPMVPFSSPDGLDLTDLKNTVGKNGAVIIHRVCADLRNEIHPTEFEALCRRLGRDPLRTRIFLDPEGPEYAALPVFNGYLIVEEEPVEIGSFHYDGNLTVEFLEPYQCMEARNASKKKRRVSLL
ncbi:MAG: hypothetical protein Q7K33_03475 [Candidatus Berkelbacteria bacterium]|nr:hypothetical protein [Candidatus Berkelbacteria bacterium]